MAAVVEGEAEVVEFARPFAAIRRDPRWLRKIALGALVNLVPYVGPVAVMGWSVEYMRRVAWGRDEELPEWSGIGKHALRGLWAFVAVMPYSAVVAVIATPVIMVLAVATTIPISLSGPDASAQFAGLAPWWFLSILGATMAPTFVLSYAITPLTMSAVARVALYDRLEAGFEFREIFGSMKASRSTLLRAWGFSTLLGVLVTIPATALGLLPMVASVSVLSAGSADDPALVVALLSLVAMPVGYAVLSVVGMVTGIASYHYWGRHAGAVYRLDAAAGGAPAAATAPAPGPAIQPGV
jgi:hypothetical protein